MSDIDRYGLLIPYSVIASYFDIKNCKIPNELTGFGFIILGTYRFLFLRQQVTDIFFIILILAVILIFYMLRLMGGGDVKFISTIIILMKWEETANWLIISILVQALFFILNRKEKLPFAPALTVGLIITGLGRW
jgi:Flp pilus assembly protein protease CpaA